MGLSQPLRAERSQAGLDTGPGNSGAAPCPGSCLAVSKNGLLPQSSQTSSLPRHVVGHGGPRTLVMAT